MSLGFLPLKMGGVSWRTPVVRLYYGVEYVIVKIFTVFPEGRLQPHASGLTLWLAEAGGMRVK